MKLSKDFEAPKGIEPYVVRTAEWRSQRPVVNRMICKKCATCYIYCPTQCISERAYHFEADLQWCKGCGICSEECPADAISMVAEDDFESG